MKSEATIYLDYQRTISQANRLSEIASRLNSISTSDLQNCLGQVSSHWEGENASSYVNKGRIVSDKIKKTSSDLKRAADTIRQMAQTTYNAEMRALAIARSLGH